jgi:hypothetical protein
VRKAGQDVLIVYQEAIVMKDLEVVQNVQLVKTVQIWYLELLIVLEEHIV